MSVLALPALYHISGSYHSRPHPEQTPEKSNQIQFSIPRLLKLAIPTNIYRTHPFVINSVNSSGLTTDL